jgi:glucokinase
MEVAIDLGGTNMRAALVNDGKCLELKSIPCPANEQTNIIIDCLTSIISEVITDDTTGIGVGVPSILDTERGIVYDVANIPSWTEVPLKDILTAKFNVPVEINNDSNCFTLGECRYGAGRGYKNVVGITVGTGIGAGVVINGKLYSGLYAGAGEIGCLPYLDSDFEHHCSSHFFKAHNTTGYDLAMLDDQGDAAAKALWHEFGTNMGNLIKAAMFAYAPEAVMLGGSIAKSFSRFEGAMLEAMSDFPYGKICKGVKVLKAELADSALLGAASLLD